MREPRVLSVNIGRPVLQRVPKGRPTGIAKGPVDVISVADPGPKRVEDGAGVSGVTGDHIGDGRHHGGSDQAVYAFAREELDVWATTLGRELPDGMFGENLTTTGLDVDASEVGDVWHVGTAVLEVRGPRVPCATFAERLGERVVLGIDGQQLGVVAGGIAHEGGAGADEALLVGQRDGAPEPERRVRGLEARRAAHRGDEQEGSAA